MSRWQGRGESECRGGREEVIGCAGLVGEGDEVLGGNSAGVNRGVWK